MSSLQGDSLKPTSSFRAHTLVTMEMGKLEPRALFSPPEAASSPLDYT